MRVVLELSGYYDWEPIPKDVAVTPADISARLVKPDLAGGWLMRVKKAMPTHATVMLGEQHIVATMIQGVIRDKLLMTREQAALTFIVREHLWHHAHRNWVSAVAVDDDGPDEALMRAMIAPHELELGEVHEMEEVAAAYMAPANVLQAIQAHFKLQVTA